MASRQRTMFPYWLLHLYFVVGALFEREARPYAPAAPTLPRAAAADANPRQVNAAFARSMPRPQSRPMLFLGSLIITAMIGLRYKVGADWIPYEYMFRYVSRLSLGTVINVLGEPGYQSLNWLVSHSGGEIWQINLVGGLIFSIGLFRFAKVQPSPWLVMVVAVPYLVIVVAMGYSRQAMAMGVLLAGLAAVHNGASTLRFAAYAALAALFHRSAAFMFPIVALAGGRNRLVNLLITVSMAYLLYGLFIAPSFDLYRVRYLEARYASEGAGIRLFLNLVPALLYLAASRRFAFSALEHRLWRYFSIVACAFPIALLLSPSSAAIDRLALYVIPLQLAILPRVPRAFGIGAFGRGMVILYSTLILLVWLNFAKNAEFWLPYQLFPFNR